MYKQILLVTIVIALTTNAGAQIEASDPNRPTGEQEHPPSQASGAAGEQEHEHEHEKKQKYTCVMHPEVITDHPGNCPKCGMKLVPVEQDKRRTSNAVKAR